MQSSFSKAVSWCAIQVQLQQNTGGETKMDEIE